MQCVKCGGNLTAEEVRLEAKKCPLCRDPLRRECYGTTVVGLVAGGLLGAIALDAGLGGIIGGVIGAIIGRAIQNYLDLQRKLQLMKSMDEANLSLPQIERKRELELDQQKRPTPQ